jgi:hypothetical protein
VGRLADVGVLSYLAFDNAEKANDVVMVDGWIIGIIILDF